MADGNGGAWWRFRQARPLSQDGRTLVMGVVNLSPDSFSGDGTAPGPAEAAETAIELLEAGAAIIDFGAESSRPGAAILPAAEEMRRLGDTVARFRFQSDAPVSVDTSHVETAGRVLDQGADIVNDITALRGGWDAQADRNSAMAELVAREGAIAILMHMPSPPAIMQEAPAYGDVFAETRDFLLRRADWAIGAGVPRENIWLDPGFGFGKNFGHNRELLLRLGELAAFGYPVLAGLSRKRLIADALALPKGERLEASLALAILASWNGAAIVRVHDVRETARAVGMADAIRLGIQAGPCGETKEG
jgi:dihydropteroate synthase